MVISPERIQETNQQYLPAHKDRFDFLRQQLAVREIDVEDILEKLASFQVAIPSWALGAGGTRFGRFSFQGEPANLEQKIDDVGIVHALTRSAGAISLHIPWDIPDDPIAVKERAASLDIVFDAVNSNTFQDQPGQKRSYKFGSLCHSDREIREQAIEHNIEVIEYGKALGSGSLTIWLADGSSFPGQMNFREAFQNTSDSLNAIYKAMPADWKMYIEYKPFEPHFYSMVIPDWGTSYLLATACGKRAFCLVDLGHHLPNTNIEQIVATLLLHGRLGGFHFNDSKYGDDDLTVGSIRPYQLFLIFNELIYGLSQNRSDHSSLAWMIDASHNLKDPLEDLMQSVEAIRLAYAQALLIDPGEMEQARQQNDVVRAQELLMEGYRTDVRALLKEARLRKGGSIDPIETYRQLGVRRHLVGERGTKIVATGL